MLRGHSVLRRALQDLASYLAVLRLPGAARAASGAVLASVPIGILGMAVLLLVQADTGRVAEAGSVTAALTVGTGVGILAQGRLVDRFGPRRVLLPAAAVQLPALVALVLAARAGAGTWLLALLAVVAGMAEPHVAGTLRALWPLQAAAPLRPVGLALTSVLFEAAVVTGPMLLALLLAVGDPATAVLLAGALFGAGAWLLTGSALARSWPASTLVPEPTPRAGCLGPTQLVGVRTVAAIAAVHGVVLGGLQVVSAAIAGSRGQPGFAAWCIAALAVGSLVGTLVAGVRRRAAPPGRDVPTLLAALCAALVLAASSSASLLLLPALCLAGACLGPVALGCYAVVDRVVPRTALVAGFTTVTAVNLGATAVGMVVAGRATDTVGSAILLLFLAGAAGVGAAVAPTALRRAGP